MICARCEKPMEPDESEVYDIPGATGPGISLRMHRELCDPAPGQPHRYPT
ncbi:hypothetical protein [Streptomyces sp. 130]|nr:hypothetical protein [Streptomyces sp. 130]